MSWGELGGTPQSSASLIPPFTLFSLPHLPSLPPGPVSYILTDFYVTTVPDISPQSVDRPSVYQEHDGTPDPSLLSLIKGAI